ncbi:MAG: hypothetical protein IJO40_10090, partial [Thermoguttaceae bacterium]|nr:hypothetical protein [Thermoguttaceae bacterium]
MKTDVEAKERAVARRRAAVRRGILAAILLSAIALGANALRGERESRLQTVDISALEAPATATKVGENDETLKEKSNVDKNAGADAAQVREEAKAERIKRRVVANASWVRDKIQKERAPLASTLARLRPEFFSGALRPNALLEAYLYCVIVAVVSAFLNLASRIFRGASAAYLLKTRFYEIPEIRVPLRVFRIFCWAFVGGWAFLTLRFAVDLGRNGGSFASGAFALFAVVATAFFYWLVRKPLQTLVALPARIDDFDVPLIRAKLRKRISRRRLNRLGRESFPEALGRGRSNGIKVRVFLVIAQATTAAAAIFAATEYGREHSWDKFAIHWVEELFVKVPDVPPAWATVFLVAGASALALLLASNASYLILRFKTVLVCGAVLSSAVVVGGFSVEEDFRSRAALVAALNLAFFARWSFDLYRAYRFKQANVATESLPVSRGLERVFGAALRGARPVFGRGLPPVEKSVLESRVEKGWDAVEFADFAALRNMTRYLESVVAESEPFAGVKFRATTVARKLERRLLGGTDRECASPNVPYWNENLFPLTVPNGYEAREDRLELGDEWDVVQDCARCGGKGTTAGTTDGSGVCSRCGGAGRVRFKQSIITTWSVFSATATEPKTPAPEYMDEAAEKIFFVKE